MPGSDQLEKYIEKFVEAYFDKFEQLDEATSENLEPEIDPPHADEFINEIYLAPYGLSARVIATHLQVAASTFAPIASIDASRSSD